MSPVSKTLPLLLLAFAASCDRNPLPPATAPASQLAPVARPAPQNWLQFQGSPQFTGIAPDLGTPPFELRWSRKTSDEDRAAVENSPAILNDTLFIADGKGTLHALALADGKTRWTYSSVIASPTTAPVDAEADPAAFQTAPLVLTRDNKTYVLLGDLNGIFHCVDAADGKRLWTFDAESAIHSSANFFTDAQNNIRIVFGCDGAKVFCLNLADGKKIWEASSGDRVNSALTVTPDNKILVSGCDAKLRILSPDTGAETAIFDLGALTGGSTAILENAQTSPQYSAWVVGTDQGRILNIDPKKLEARWTYTGVDDQAMVYSSPALTPATAILGARDRTIHALDLATGKPRWTFKTRGDVDASAVISGNHVYVGSKDKKLYALDIHTGKLVWEFSATRAITAPVAIATEPAGSSGGVGAVGAGGGAKGVLILADTAGNIYCFENSPPQKSPR